MDPSCSASAAVAAPPGLTVQVCFPTARAAVLDNLNRQREEGRLCDLSIQVQGQVFRAHRCVLAASSPYFHDQVLLKNVTTVSLPSVMDPLAFESVLSSAYTGQLSIVHDDIVNYVTVASFLQMWHIVDKCTEILKRSRPSADAAATEAAAAAAHSGTASRQQSPSSTDCLYMEREGRRRERRPDALPPLATWRRPQQFPRWGRQRAAAAPQHSADSQLDAGAAYGESEYAASEEVWGSGAPRAAHLAHDGAAHGGRQQGAPLNAEAARQRGRWQQRGAGPNDRSRESRESEEAPSLERKNERREIEADEGVGEEAEDEKKKELSHCELGPVLSDEARMAAAAAAAGVKASAEEPRDKTPRDVTGSNLASELPGPSGGGGASRAPWQPGSWSQPEPRPPEGGACHGGEEEEEVDFECLADGAFGRDTYDEIQDGTGQVSQRPLLPASPDFTLAGSEGSWPAPCGSPPAPRHLPPPSSSAGASAAFPPPPSPPTPSSSSSSVSLAGAPYAGKVHFCHCGKAYTLKSMRDRHVKMQHLNLRPFGCPVCTKSFKMKHHLTKHLKTHGGLRPYECSVCGKKVIWRDSFLRHQARCQRLAHNDAASAAGAGTSAAAANAEPEEGYGYAFEDGEAFLAMGGGAVKVEEADFGGEMGGLLGGMVEELAVPPQGLEGGAQVFKEEASEGFGQS